MSFEVRFLCWLWRVLNRWAYRVDNVAEWPCIACGSFIGPSDLQYCECGAPCCQNCVVSDEDGGTYCPPCFAAAREQNLPERGE